ncbi:MAG: sensor domain-containing diguanylate cyclase [Planctomycetes bacterium]|nr:sensor domain-containing diguanylate cyclase [Planctomycetota bacterium]
MEKNDVNESGPGKTSPFSPMAILAVLLASVFLVEILTMTILSYLRLDVLPEMFFDSLLLTAAIFPVLYFFVFRPAKRHINELHDAKENLREVHDNLAAYVQELEKKNREITLQGQMNELLQTSRGTDEALRIISQFVPKIFSDISGGLYIFNPSKNLAVPVVVWGKTDGDDSFFVPQACWAIRLGRLHASVGVFDNPKCMHTKGEQLPSICMPLMAQGEALGVLRLVFEKGDNRQNDRKLVEEMMRSVTLVGEQIALTLANMKLHETMRNMSIRDPLTDLFNRRYMEESFERELRRSERKNVPLGVIMIDIDNFKPYNDTFGHDAGDELLRELGALFQKNTRDSDIACRYGGDEFTIILPESPLETARQRAELLREAFKKLNIKRNTELDKTVSLSAGISVFPEHGKTAGILLKTADKALYKAKQAGRDNVCMASNEV